MKKLLASAFAALGIANGAQAAPPPQDVDPRTMRFSMPTVAADDIQFVMPTRETFEIAPQFHEDEWSQIEFFPASRLAEIKARLTEYKAFEKNHRTPNGWTDIYARRITRSPVIPGSNAVAELANLVHASILPAPILTTTSRALGQVKSGYTLQLPGEIMLYGMASDLGLQSLGALVERDGNDQSLAATFEVLNKNYGLVLADWRSQIVFVNTNSQGAIDVWRP